MDRESFKALKKTLPLATLITLVLFPKNCESSKKTAPSLESKVGETFAPLVITDPLNEPLREIPLPYESFPYRNELEGILLHSQRLNVPAELIMAIRMAENGGEGREYGILPSGTIQKTRYAEDTGYRTLQGEFRTYVNDGEKQLAWAARTVQKNQERFNLDHKNHADFISYLASVYAPHDAPNDPSKLNKNWEKNVRFYYEKLKDQKPK